MRSMSLFALAAASMLCGTAAQAGTRLGDHLFWIPRFEDALAHAKETGKPIFVIGYTCTGGSKECAW